MKKSLLLIPISAFLSTFGLSQGTPVIGSPSISQKCFDAEFVSQALVNQEFPKLIQLDSNYFVNWVNSGSPAQVGGVELNPLTNTIEGTQQTIISSMGTLTSAGTGNEDVAVLPNGMRLQVYVKSQSGNFALMGKLYNSLFDGNEFIIEGSFSSANMRPGYARISHNNDNKFVVVYQSNPAVASPCIIRYKVIDVTDVMAPVVTPAASSTGQNGTTLSGGIENLARFPEISFNSTNSQYGVVWASGNANSSVIKFASINEDGSLGQAPVTINELGFQADAPVIKEDGGNYAIAWRDYRTLNVDAQLLEGKPSIRFKKVTATGGNLSTFTHPDSEIFDAGDNSLLVSNPYSYEASIFSDLIVNPNGQEYGLVWATQSAPYEVQFSRVLITGSAIDASIYKKVNEGVQSADRPSIVMNGNQYVIAFDQYDAAISKWNVALAIDTADCFTAAINDKFVDFGVQLFPNPSSDFSEIQTIVPVNFTLFSIDGKELMATTSFSNAHQLDLTNLLPGTYMLILSDGINAQTKKLVKQ